MKVKDATPIRASTPAAPVEPGRAPSRGAGGATDRVSTAESARIEAAVAEASRGAATARTQRLAAIEAAVRQGTYRPDPARIAQEILEEAELAARLQALFTK